MSKKGSQWRKWDLHFHTPASYDYNDNNTSNQEIIDGLHANNIAVIAITDHHIIDVGRITELQRLGAERGITVLPGIEFLSDSRGSDPIHYIGIFPENSNLAHIWGQIENKTEIQKIKGENKKHNEVYCNLLETAKLIRKLGGIVTIHAGTKSNTLENITNALPHGVAQKEDIAKVIDIFEIGKETDLEPYNKIVIPYLKNKIDKHHPMIICSDNHRIKEYTIKQNLWIKSDPTFEGLRQILFEPEHRVRIQDAKPDFKEDKLIIDEVRFISPDNQFSPDPIHFNENLNVIIGGKSSGKSILLYNIAKTLLADDSFFKKEGIDEKYKFKRENDSFNFEVKTKVGFSQLLYRGPEENSILPEIKYIPQNYLVKLAEPEENKKNAYLDSIVRDLINEDDESLSQYNDFISKLKQNDKKRESAIDAYFETKDKIIQLETQLKTKSNKEILQKNIEINSKKVEALNKGAGMTPQQIEEYNQLQRQIEELKSNRQNAFEEYKKIASFNNETIDSLVFIKGEQESLIQSITHPILNRLLTEKYKELNGVIETLRNFSSILEIYRDEDGKNKFLNISEVSQIFTDLSDKRTLLEKKIEPYVKNEGVKKQIEEITKSISDDKTALQAIDQLTKEIGENQKTLLAEKHKLFDLYQENYDEYHKIIKQLKSRTIDLEKDDLKIEGLIRFNFPRFRKTMLDISDGRKASYNSFSIFHHSKTAKELYNIADLINDLKTVFDEIEKDEYALLGRINKSIAIKELLRDYFFDSWQIEYKNDKLGEMSTGKASFVILMLIIGLSKSKAPILIDQPEDNLDNRSITTDLVEYLRNKKLERQIILVTHNPNIVVNADAENIIVANQKGQNDIESTSQYQFDYVNGSLENSFSKIDSQTDLLKSMGIREHIADIVEGGKEAFKKREKKYGFRKS